MNKVIPILVRLSQVWLALIAVAFVAFTAYGCATDFHIRVAVGLMALILVTIASSFACTMGYSEPPTNGAHD